MSKAPKFCPMCHKFGSLKRVDKTRKGLSAGKAIVGGVLIGPIGSIVGASMGKKKATYVCKNCGFEHEYDR